MSSSAPLAPSKQSCWEDCASLLGWIIPAKLMQTGPRNGPQNTDELPLASEIPRVSALATRDDRDQKYVHVDLPTCKDGSGIIIDSVVATAVGPISPSSKTSEDVEERGSEVDVTPRSSMSIVAPHKPRSSLSTTYLYCKQPMDEDMFLPNDEDVDPQAVVAATMKKAVKNPKALLGWKIELLEGAPYRDIRVISAVEKKLLQHAHFCVHSVLRAQAEALSVDVEALPPATEWIRLKREKQGRPFRLLRKVLD
eukprot:gene29981-36215_t